MQQGENTKEKLLKRRELKKRAKKNIKHQYIRNIIIVFLTAVIINGGIFLNTNNSSVTEVRFEDTTYLISGKKSNTEIITEFFVNRADGVQPEHKSQKAYQQGLLKVFINEITKSGSTLFGFLNAFNQLFFQGLVSEFIIIIIFAVISFILYFLVQNVISVGKNRYFLEQRKYSNISVDRILFPYKVKRTLHLAYILFCKYIYQILWSFTIVGGFIKHYEYFFIPYVLAENPDLTKKEAFELSKKLSYGEKWKTFKTEFSFIGWALLDSFTFGLIGIFYYYPYRECTYAELYMNLRETKKDNISELSLLPDTLLISEYKEGEYLEETLPTKINNRSVLKKLDYKQNYDIETYILLFFTFAFVGWFWEASLHLANYGVFVNPGTLHGPWIPIYAVGLLSVLVLLKPFREKTSVLFIATVILCGVIEYGTGWYLETFKHLKWWDYTGYFLNIQGRVCLEILIIFGLGGCAVTYIFAPMLNNLYKKMKPNIKRVLCVILILFFIIDFIYSKNHPNSGEGITTPVAVNKSEAIYMS